MDRPVHRTERERGISRQVHADVNVAPLPKPARLVARPALDCYMHSIGRGPLAHLYVTDERIIRLRHQVERVAVLYPVYTHVGAELTFDVDVHRPPVPESEAQTQGLPCRAECREWNLRNRERPYTSDDGCERSKHHVPLLTDLPHLLDLARVEYARNDVGEVLQVCARQLVEVGPAQRAADVVAQAHELGTGERFGVVRHSARGGGEP